MNKFIAIDVNQGDAFYLERQHFSILVDGGRSKINFPNQFEDVTKRKFVDVVICTHNDSDHANGILGFMGSHLKCNEVWLPGSWTTRLKDLLINPIGFLKELFDDIDNKNLTINIKTMEDIANNTYLEEMENLKKIENEFSGEIDEIFADIEEINELNIRYPNEYFNLLSPWFFNENKVQLLLDAISYANRIREIAISAYNKGAKIRWFEYSSFERSGGIKDVLEPINSKEILLIPRYKPTALDYLTLTTSNKESLVFMSPSNDTMPCVMFSADSDYSFNQSINWENGMIITTPHHGSEANKNFYDKFKEEADNDIVVKWVRSDCKSKRRPGPSLLNVKGDKFCTLCRKSEHPRKRLLFKSNSCDKWHARGTRKCTCK